MMTVGIGVIVVIGSSITDGVIRLAATAAFGVGDAVLVRRSRPMAAATILGVLACAAAVSGTVIAVPHLLAAGPSAAVVGSAVAALGGLLAVGFAAAQFVRAVPGTRRLLALPIIVVLGYASYLPLGVAVYATNPPRAALEQSTPATYDLSYDDVSFTSVDGATLSGWYIPAHNGGAVTLLPGSGSTRSSVLQHAVVLARHGYGVLMFDPRGHGDSGGQAMEFGWYGERDIAAAVRFLQQQPDIAPDRIGAIGLSMGGEEAIGALAADRRISAVVAEGATNRVLTDKAWLPDSYGIHGRPARGRGRHLRADRPDDRRRPADLPRRCGRRRCAPACAADRRRRGPRRSRCRHRYPGSLPGHRAVVGRPGSTSHPGPGSAPTMWESRVTTFLAAAFS